MRTTKDNHPLPCLADLPHRWRAAFQSASPRRAAVEGSALSVVMLALVFSAVVRSRSSQALVGGCFLVGELAALVLALRLRLPQGTRSRQLGAELATAAVFA